MVVETKNFVSVEFTIIRLWYSTVVIINIHYVIKNVVKITLVVLRCNGRRGAVKANCNF